ncbi:MAG: O-antigen ligase family protein [Anaerolineae bacterium]|nr:O-antigen ligase family protein [Anaerolineae bacterium]
MISEAKSERRGARAGKAGLVLGVLLLGFALGTALTTPSWEMVITAVGWMAQVGAILLDPLLGLLLWIVISPYAPFIHLNLDLGSGIPDLSLDRLAAGVLCVVLLAQAARRSRRLAPFTPLDGAIIVFSLPLALSARASLQGVFSALQLMFDTTFIPFLVYILARNLVRDRRALRGLFLTLGIIAGYLIVLTVREQVTGQGLFVIEGRVASYGANLTRVNSLLQNPAYIALALNLVLPFALRAALRAGDTRERWAYGLACVLLVGTVISLYNRAGWLSALLVLLLSAWYYPRLRRWLLVALLVLALVTALFWNTVRESALFSERLTSEPSVDYRLRAARAVLQLVASQPLVGVGFNNFAPLSLSRELITKHTPNWWLPTPHNSYLDVLLAAGLLGLLPFLAIFVAILWESGRLYRRAASDPGVDRSLIVALWGAFLAFVVSIATFDIVAAPFCALVFYLIVGAILGSQSVTGRQGEGETG